MKPQHYVPGTISFSPAHFDVAWFYTALFPNNQKITGLSSKTQVLVLEHPQADKAVRGLIKIEPIGNLGQPDPTLQRVLFPYGLYNEQVIHFVPVDFITPIWTIPYAHPYFGPDPTEVQKLLDFHLRFLANSQRHGVNEQILLWATGQIDSLPEPT